MHMLFQMCLIFYAAHAIKQNESEVEFFFHFFFFIFYQDIIYVCVLDSYGAFIPKALHVYLANFMLECRNPVLYTNAVLQAVYSIHVFSSD